MKALIYKATDAILPDKAVDDIDFFQINLDTRAKIDAVVSWTVDSMVKSAVHETIWETLGWDI